MYCYILYLFLYIFCIYCYTLYLFSYIFYLFCYALYMIISVFFIRFETIYRIFVFLLIKFRIIMLKINLHPICRLRGVAYPRRFFTELGINHLSVSKLLKGETTSLRLEHIEKICLALRCTPNDLLEWTPDKSFSADSAHPLHAIAPRKNIDRLLERLGNMSYEEMERMMEEE